MSVTIRPYRRGGWEVDIRVVTPDGTRQLRERKRAPVSSRSAAARWAEGRERVLFERLMNPPQDNAPPKEVPTLREFAPRFVDGHARANRQKPSGIAAKEMILRVHLMPALGHKKLDAIKSEDVQRLKSRLSTKAPKTVNNVLTVLNVLLKKAVEWDVIERMPCTITLLPVPKTSMAFHDFDEYERLVDGARRIDRATHLIVLLGGEAGPSVRRDDRARVGRRRSRASGSSASSGRTGTARSRHRRADGCGTCRSPIGWRRRSRDHRHLRSPRVLCQDDGKPLTRQIVQYRMMRAARRAKLSHEGVHILRHTFCSHLAMRGAPARAIQELAGHRGSDDDAALHAPESGGARQRRFGCWISRPASQSFGDILETGSGLRRKDQWIEQLNWR